VEFSKTIAALNVVCEITMELTLRTYICRVTEELEDMSEINHRSTKCSV